MTVKITTEINKLYKTKYLWKVVREGRKSMFSPDGRIPQDISKFTSTGIDKEYILGREVVSPFDTTPGLYCFESYDDAVSEMAEFNCGRIPILRYIIKVRVDAGTKFYKGEHNCKSVWLVESLTVES